MTTALHAGSIGAWLYVVKKAFSGNPGIRIGKPDIVASAGVPDFASKVGILCYDKTNDDVYICTVATGTWVKINA